MLKNAFYIALFTLISWGSYQLSYPSNTPPDLFYDGIFFENVIKHVDQLTRGPRAVGEYYHDDAQRYLITELQEMGLTVSRHKTISFNTKNRTAAPVTNIMATYPGTDPASKDLLLLSHYDAAKFSGTGAGDDASGVAVILEAVNALIKTAPIPTNDILIMFTDAEEIGLLGAHAFINEKLPKYDIGLIINLEARGTSGPSMMWPETVEGNRAMIEAFQAADVPMPVTTSLHYEIYKMLPNDTDLTPFNKVGKINGFNFAFIDDHHNYHTRLDNLDNLSLDTLAHQTIQVHAMLKHFAEADLSALQDDKYLVYFSLPLLGLISYPVAINWLLLLLSAGIFIISLATSLKLKKSSLKGMMKGLSTLLLACIISYAWCWLLLKLINFSYPELRDVMQGFPYQGHQIMLSLLVGAGIITLSVFGLSDQKNKLNQMIAAIILWFLLLIPLLHFMPGAGLILWPLLLAVLLFAAAVYQPKIAIHLAPILAVLAFLLIGVMLINLPIALGVAAIPITAIIAVSLLALFRQAISPVKSVSHVLIMLLIPLVYLIYSFEKQPSISQIQPHPTSLSYLYDTESQQGYFYNYDVISSGWNDELFAQKSGSDDISAFRKQYKKPLRNLVNSETNVPLTPIEVAVFKPLKQGENQILEVTIGAHANTEILEIYTNEALTIHKLSIDGRSAVLSKPLQLRSGGRLLQYYFDGKKQIKLLLEIDKGATLNWQLQSHSTDLLQRPEFNLTERPNHQIQKPFIKSDNTTVVQSMTFGFNK